MCLLATNIRPDNGQGEARNSSGYLRFAHKAVKEKAENRACDRGGLKRQGTDTAAEVSIGRQ